MLPCPTWYRSRLKEYCGPGVLPCPTWYRSRSREYCGPMVLPCPTWYRSNTYGVLSCQTWYRSRSREYCSPGYYHVQHAFTFRGAAMSNMVPFTFKGILRSRVLPCPTWCLSRSREYCGPGLLPCPTWYRSRSREYSNMVSFTFCFLDFASGVSPRRKLHFVRKMAQIKSACQAALNTASAQIVGKDQRVQGCDQ